MTLEEFNQYIARLKVDAFMLIKNTAPYRSGALARAIYIQDNVDGFSIISPIKYMKYTEEPWDKTFTKDGRENPNLYWLKEITEFIVKKARRDLNAETK